MFKPIPPLTERQWRNFRNKIDAQPGGCWHWQGGVDKSGYGAFHLGNSVFHAHRIAYSLFYKLPYFGLLKHRCNNMLCVCPGHLDIVSTGENGWHGSRNGPNRYTHCKHGHLLESNLKRKANGRRYCAACHRKNSLANYHRKRKGG